jgi:hypothetical protein
MIAIVATTPNWKKKKKKKIHWLLGKSNDFHKIQ